jgi:hypothetical protein
MNILAKEKRYANLFHGSISWEYFMGGINPMKIIKNMAKNIADNFREHKMRYKYILSTMIIILIFGLSFFLISETSSIFRYWDIPSFLCVGILPLLVMCVFFGPSTTRKIFSVPFAENHPIELLNESFLFFKMFNKIISGSTLLVIIVNAIEILSSLSGFSSLTMDYRTALAVTLISPLYAILINLTVIIPYNIFIRRQLNKRELEGTGIIGQN